MTDYELIVYVVLFVIIIGQMFLTRDISGIIITLLMSFGLFGIIQLAKSASDEAPEKVPHDDLSRQQQQNTGSTQIIETTFQDILGRAPTSTEYERYMTLLSAGWTREEIVHQIRVGCLIPPSK